MLANRQNTNVLQEMTEEKINVDGDGLFLGYVGGWVPINKYCNQLTILFILDGDRLVIYDVE